MKEIEKVAPTDVTIILGGKERKIKFGFSAWAKLEEKYNGIKNVRKLEEDVQVKPFQTIPFLLWLGLTDKEGLDEKTFLDEYGFQEIKEISVKLFTALYGSLPKDEEEKKAEGSR
jgi:hypothetical protein